MMRTCLLLAALLTTANTLTTNDAAVCSINGVAAADELVNSVLFIWQAASRCGKEPSASCSVDVNSAIESVTGMINVILKAVQRCGGVLRERNARCGMAAGEVTEAVAGIAATSSGIHEHCGNNGLQPVPGLNADFLVGTKHMTPKLASCIVDIKSLTLSILKAALGFSTVKTNCDDNTGACVGNVLYIVVSMAELGEYIAGVVGHCSTPANHEAACASEIMGLLRSLADLSSAGHELNQACVLDSADRLYLANGPGATKAPDGPSLSLGLAVLLPFTAVLSFVGGRRMAKSERMPGYDTEVMVTGTE